MQSMSFGDRVASPPPPTEKELIAIRYGSAVVANALVCCWEDCVGRIAGARHRDENIADQAMQVGRIAVWQATLKFDLGRPVATFPRYAKRAIKNARTKFQTRRPHSFTELTDASPIHSDRFGYERPNPHQEAAAIEACEVVERFIWTQPKALQQVYEALYVEGLSQRDAAARLGITQPRVAQLHAELKTAGRAALQSYWLN